MPGQQTKVYETGGLGEQRPRMSGHLGMYVKGYFKASAVSRKQFYARPGERD